jgi:hypothetical protein
MILLFDMLIVSPGVSCNDIGQSHGIVPRTSLAVSPISASSDSISSAGISEENILHLDVDLRASARRSATGRGAGKRSSKESTSSDKLNSLAGSFKTSRIFNTAECACAENVKTEFDVSGSKLC